MTEIRLNKLTDPIGFTLKVLKRAASVCETIQTDPKVSISLLYKENESAVDECHRDLNVAWNGLRQVVIEAAEGHPDTVKETREKVQRAVVRGVGAAQKAIDLFDDLCVRYRLAIEERSLFLKIGSVLNP